MCKVVYFISSTYILNYPLPRNCHQQMKCGFLQCSLLSKINLHPAFGILQNCVNLVMICDRIWEKGPYRANNDFSV